MYDNAHFQVEDDLKQSYQNQILNPDTYSIYKLKMSLSK